MKRFFLFVFALASVLTLHAQTKHNYTINVYVPECSSATFKPVIIGSFCNWEFNYGMSALEDTQHRTYYSITLYDVAEGEEFKFREAHDYDWGNEIQVFDPITNVWNNFGNNVLPATSETNCTLTYDYSGSNYRWSGCEYAPTNLQVVQNADNTYTLSWDANSVVSYYNAQSYYPTTDTYPEYKYPSDITTENGRCSTTFQMFPDNGTYTFYVYAYDDSYRRKAQNQVDFQVSGIKGMGQATLNVLIPSDCCFDVSGGVWFRIKAGLSNDFVKATSAGGGWYTASFNVKTAYYDFNVLDSNDFSTATQTTDYYFGNNESNMYYYMLRYSGSDRWSLNRGNSSMMNHNYAPTDAEVTADNTNATFTITISYQNASPNGYYARLYKAGTDEYEECYFSSDKNATSVSMTLPSSFATATAFDKLEVWARDENYNLVCQNISIAINVTVPASAYAPTGLTAVKNTDNTYTLSWNAQTGTSDIKYYYVYAQYQGSNYIADVQGWNVYPSSTEPVNGKYSVTLTPIANGDYKFSVLVYDNNYNKVGEASAPFTVSGLTNLGDVSLRVLISPGVDFDVSKGVWFCYRDPINNTNRWAEATTTGDYWYEAAMTIDAPSYQFNVMNANTWNGNHQSSYDSEYLTVKNACYEFRVSRSVTEIDCNAVAHDYTIQSVAASEQGGIISFTITAKEYAPNYAVYYRINGSSEQYYNYLTDGSLDSNHSLSVVVNESQDCVYDYYIVAIDDNWNSLSQPYYGTVNVSASPYAILNMSATAVGGNVYELSWDAKTGVDHFYIGYHGADNKWKYATLYPSDLTVNAAGKYTFLTESFTVSGEAYWYIRSYDSDNNRRGYSKQTFDVTVTDLGLVTLRVQIPTYNNMDITNGVWFWWKLPSEDETQWKAVKATAAKDRWFEASINVTATEYYFAVANADDLSSSTIQITYYTSVKSATACYMVLYNSNPDNKAWKLASADCNAPDRDYRITSVTTDNSQEGKLTFTVTAKDIADAYDIYARIKGSSDAFSYYTGWYGSNGNQGTATFSNTQDTLYEYMIVAYMYDSDYDSFYHVNTYTDFATVKANPNVPTDLEAKVATDGKIVSFSWTTNKNSKADHYAIYAFDRTNGLTRGTLYNITGNSATMKLLMADTYYWYLEIYDADDNWIGEAIGPDFTITGKDYSPTDLDFSVNGQTATLTWKADKDVEKCAYYIYNNNNFGTGRLEATGKNGVYSVTFTPPVGTYGDFNWEVYAAQNANEYFISHSVTGPSFTIDAPATTPTDTYTFQVDYYGYGNVSNGLNGTYPAGTQLTISAVAYGVWEFFGWSDGNKDAIRTVTLNQNINLIAYFVNPSNQYTLTISAGEGGAVNTEVNGSYADYTPITLIATPNSGYEFEKWSDDNTNPERLLFIIDDDVTLTAYFKQKGGDPSLETVYVNCGDNFTWSYESKDKVWLIAGQNNTYRAQVGVKSTNLLSPTGTYSSDNGDFDLSYTLISYLGGTLVADVTKAEATVTIDKGIIKATAKLTCDNNKIYVVTMEMEVPTAKYQRTVTALNLKREANSGVYSFTASDESYKVLISVPQAEGTFTLNDGATYAEVAPAGTNDYTRIVSGSIIVTDNNGRLTLTGKMLSYSSIEFTLDLSNYTTVRVLRPTDNNFDIQNGMWIWSWPKNGNGELSKAEDLKNGWFEATIILTGEDFNFLAVNKDVSGGDWTGSRQTIDLNGVKTATSCYEIGYNQVVDNTQSKWGLYPVDCATANHNYAFTAAFDNSNVGRIAVTLTTEEVAPLYRYGYRVAGSTDAYTFSTIDAYGKKELNLSFNNITETEYELLLCGVKKDLNGKEFDVTAMVETTIKVKANSNIPEDLDAKANKEQVTFSWTAKGTETSYYIVQVTKGGEIYYESAPVTGTTVSTSLYEDGTYDWTLAAYTVKGERLSEPAGPQFTITDVPNLRPTNLDVTVKGAKATLTWAAPAPVDECQLIIYEENPYMEVVQTLVPGNGSFTYNYTFVNYDKRTLKWSVSSRISGHAYYASAAVYGNSFKAEEGAQPDPTPTTQQFNFAFDHTGLGTVTSDKPAGKYDENTVITLTAKPDQGWYLEKWSDGRTTLERTITLTQDTNLVAIFKSLQKYKVTIQAGSHGSVEPEIINKEYDGGAVIKIKAIPAADYKFVKWEEDGVTEAERSIAITQDTVLTAKFAEIQYYRLTVEVVPAKGGNVLFNGADVDLSKKYKEGTTVKLTAEAKSGYQFDHYEFGAENIKTAEYSVVMNKNISITAYFKVKEEGINDVQRDDVQCTKILRDGQIYILRDGKMYTITGAAVTR